MSSRIQQFFSRFGRQPTLTPIAGTLSQFPGSSEGRERLQLVMGLDFGTAFTKMVIAERRRAYAVPLNDQKNGNTYLLPCVFYTGPDGLAALRQMPGATTHSGLKMRLLDGDLGNESLSQAACFLALVLRQARSWFLITHQVAYRDYLLDWYVNIGTPTEHYHDRAMTGAYRRMVAAAWAASTVDAPISLNMVRAHLEDCSRTTLDESAIEVFPEFVGQINGYVRSSLRRQDLHLLVDVGAGTLDVVVFIAHRNDKDGEDVFPIFAKSVKRLGVHFLQKHRGEAVGSRSNSSASVGFESDENDSSVARALGLSLQQLKHIDEPFARAVLAAVEDQIRITRTQYYPESTCWSEGVTFFLCGGGSRVALYADLATRMERDRAPCPLVRLEIPKPERLVADQAADTIYDRLSVAYGLSFDALDIGQIQRTEEIARGGAGQPLDPGSLCPRCKGTGGWRGNDCPTCAGRGWA